METRRKNNLFLLGKKLISSFLVLSVYWRNLLLWLQSSTLVAPWMPEKWQPPLMRYLFALLGLAGVLVVLWHAYPAFGASSLFMLFFIAFAALTWGAGPGFLVASLGAVKIFFFLHALPPHWSSCPGAFVEGFLFFVAGICISDMLFRTKKAGRERERLEREREETWARERALVATQQRMDTFLSMASHELRTPLTIISFSAAVMQRLLREVCHNGNFDADKLNRIQDLGQDVERQVSVLDRLVGDLLQASRLHAGKLEYQLVPCDLVPVIRRSIVEQQQLAPERSIRLIIEPDDDMVTVLADALRIGQVLTNYLVNALKYSGPEQPVEVSLRREQEGSLRVVVHDKGPGLSAEEQEHLWERFYQVERVKELSGSHRGLGLGLSISRAIIEHHGGCVGVESEQGKGSAFWFTLPLVQE